MERKATYMVVEAHSAYAVVLDNSGRFIKVANSEYAVGDITDKVIPLIYPRDKKKRKSTIIRLAASLAACVALCVFGIYEYQYVYTEYGSIHMQINPEVEISLSRSGRVLEIEGENADGDALLQGYNYKGKDKETVVDDTLRPAVPAHVILPKVVQVILVRSVEAATQISIIADGEAGGISAVHTVIAGFLHPLPLSVFILVRTTAGNAHDGQQHYSTNSLFIVYCFFND